MDVSITLIDGRALVVTYAQCFVPLTNFGNAVHEVWESARICARLGFFGHGKQLVGRLQPTPHSGPEYCTCEERVASPRRRKQRRVCGTAPGEGWPFVGCHFCCFCTTHVQNFRCRRALHLPLHSSVLLRLCRAVRLRCKNAMSDQDHAVNPLAGRPTSPASHGAGSDDDPRDAADIAAAAVAAVAARRALAASGGSTELGLSGSPIAVGDSTSRGSQGGDGRRSDHPLSNTMSSMQRFDSILAKRSAKDVLSGEVGDTTGADSGSDSSDDGGGATPRAVGATSGSRLITRRSSKSVSSILSGISEAQRREQRRKLLAKANQLAGVDEATQGGAVDAPAGQAAEAGAAESAVRQQAASAAQPVATRSRAFTVDQATMKHHHRHHRRRRKRHRRHHRERSGAMRTHHHRTRARSATKHRVPRGTRTLKSTLKATQRRLAKLQSKLQVRWVVTCLQSVHRAREWWPGDDRL